jgi:cytochrome c oxidase assembly protein subunit 15
LLGGITRLTGSGLSITEWDVITGALPPLSNQQWMAEFDKYRNTPQFHLLHSYFTLSDFKFIFFWEWLHRIWARLVAVVFIVGFIYLVWKNKMKQWMILPLAALFLIGALQGAVGWIMVASGLTGDAIYVKPTRLAIHFVLALGLISSAFWIALSWWGIPKERRFRCPGLRNWTVLIIIFIFLQFLFGALMAGNKAASAAPTWPTINGDWLPSSLWIRKPFLMNFIENLITIQFIHRGLAYLIFLLVLIWTIKASGVKKIRQIPLLLTLIQVGFGICAVLISGGITANHWGAFEWIALLHQFIGMIMLLSMIYMYFLLGPSPSIDGSGIQV